MTTSSASFPVGSDQGNVQVITADTPDIEELGVTLVATLVNPDVGDLMLTDAGDEVQLRERMDCVNQRLQVRLRFFRGEWFLDQDLGTPYYEQILIKAPRDSIVRAVLGQVIRDTEGVETLKSLTYSVGADRRMRVTFRATVEGVEYRSTDYGPFLVTLG